MLHNRKTNKNEFNVNFCKHTYYIQLKIDKNIQLVFFKICKCLLKFNPVKLMFLKIVNYDTSSWLNFKFLLLFKIYLKNIKVKLYLHIYLLIF